MKRYLYYGTLLFTSLGIIGLVVLFSIYLWVSKDLPSITKIEDYRPKQVTTVYARDKSILGYLYEEKRFLVNLDRIPNPVIKAFMAAEDDAFYTHPGISIKGILRAFISNVMHNHTGAGGSTITQQLVKQLLLTREKTYERKIKEAILSYKLEKYLSKDQILYLYLNHIYLGAGAHGVEAAARTYFGKHIEELTIAEAAGIASLPQKPSDVNPYANIAKFTNRQQWVLSRMQSLGYITDQQYEEAKAQKLDFHQMPDPSWKLGAYYLEAVRRELIDFLREDNVRRLNIPLDIYGEEALYAGGLNVYTAMDPVHQAAAEQSLRAGLHSGYKRSGWHGPLEHLEKEAIPTWLKENSFSPEDLADAKWAKAVVTSVEKAGAKVRLGAFKGYIPVSTMAWARRPNAKQMSEWIRVTDATGPLKKGDVVFVSAYGATGTTNPVGVPADPYNKVNPIPAYNPSEITENSVIKLCLEQEPLLQGAMASIETSTGDLVALVGGYKYSPTNQFDRATQALRQPGSSFKPVVYSTALDNGFTAGSIIMDSPFELNDPWTKKIWTPRNFDGKFLGPLPLRTALALSRNVCTVRVAQLVGMKKVVERAHQLGITSEIPEVLAVSLGSADVTPLNMAEAYTPFANRGNGIKPRKIISIANNWNETVANIVPDIYPAITEQNAYLMASLLKDVVNAGTAIKAKVLDRPIGGKTGTSNEERNAWFMGISPYLVTSTWVGYDDNRPIGKNETGGRAALPIFVDYRKRIDPLYEPEDFIMPAGIVMVQTDAETGYLAGPSTSKSLYLPYVRGTEPTIVSGAVIDRGSEEVQSGEDIMKQMFN